jgi:hypothetical protein
LPLAKFLEMTVYTVTETIASAKRSTTTNRQRYSMRLAADADSAGVALATFLLLLRMGFLYEF